MPDSLINTLINLSDKQEYSSYVYLWKSRDASKI
jgi:hypothetical protein